MYKNAQSNLHGKHIVLGITGSIAAYKAASLARLLVKRGAEVQVVMTPAACEFITPLTMSTITSRPVITTFFSSQDGSWHSHVDLGLWADAMVIAPATASTIGKMVGGVADNMLITTYLSAKAPVFVAPAMDLDMYRHPSTQRNLDILRSWGVQIIEAADGELASHLIGKGRMQEPEVTVDSLELSFSTTAKTMQGRTVLITAGPTYERIDPVRFIGNDSSGRMGIALAENLYRKGATVHLVLGPSSIAVDQGIDVVRVESAQEMFDAAERLFPSVDAAIFAAAVADYRPEQQMEHKIKREKQKEQSLRLVRNPDIAASLSAKKSPEQRVIGFALETDNGLDEAKRKRKEKHLDAIILNTLQDQGAGFGTNTNKISIIEADDNVRKFALKDKLDVAEDIVQYLISIIPPTPSVR